MSDYLTRFQAKTRRKADPELIRRWAWDAEFHGDEKIKIQLATAKRTATSMQRAISQFSNLKSEHERAINTAAGAMRALASELTALAAWARDYKAFCDAERKLEDAAALEAVAASRWRDDVRALKFEVDLLRELQTDEGKLAFAGWCHAQRKYLDCALTAIHPPVDHPRPEATERATAARIIQHGQREHRLPNQWRGIHGNTAIGSWADYEAYLAYRKTVERAAAQLVETLSNR